MSRAKGVVAEAFAKDFLISQGLSWVESNYFCKVGEIDLVMREENIWVFVEVKARASTLYGHAVESVTPSKQRKLAKAAWHYLLAKKIHQPITRFDVLALEGTQPQMTWLKNAFGSEL